MLSMYDGDLIAAADAYKHFISSPECASIGVVGVSCEECTTQAIPIIEDRQPFNEHILLNFSGMKKKLSC